MPSFFKHELSAVNRLAFGAPTFFAELLELLPAELEPLPELPHAASATQAPRTQSARNARTGLRLVG
jgi:hypothetical protein